MVRVSPRTNSALPVSHSKLTWDTVMNASKKQREREALDAVLAHLGIAPSPIEETEEPDFLFPLNATHVGAEVTELYLPSPAGADLPEQATENEERIMVEMARQRAIQQQVPAQQMQLRLSPHVLTKRQRKAVSADIYDFVASNFASPGEVRSFRSPQLPQSIVHMTLYGLRDTPHTWNGPCSGWVHSNFTDGFQDAIDKKEKLRSKYLHRCSEIWLITVATHDGGSSFIEWSPALAAHQFSSRFDRAFFVEGKTHKVNELQVTPLQQRAG